MAMASAADATANRNDIVRQVTNVVTLVVVLVVNYLANALPLNGQYTYEVSDRFPVYFVPAGYVFAIWGLIYLALTAFTVYQALPSQRANPALRRVGYLVAASSLVNSAWIFFWHYEQFALTVIAMLALLALLIAVYVRLGVGVRPVGLAMRWLVHVPFSLYLGWITVATVANVTDGIYLTGWDGWGLSAQAWGAVIVGAAALIASAVAATRRDLAYVLVILWAFAGIAVKQANAPLVANAALVFAAVVALVWAVSALLARRGTARLQARTA